MPTLDSEIKNFVSGDDLDVIRTIGNLPVGQTIAKAWFTVKTKKLDTTPLFQKIITTVNVLGQGHITDIGGDEIGAVRFELTAADTKLLVNKKVFFFDIQIRTSAGKVFTPELGRIRAEIERTVVAL